MDPRRSASTTAPPTKTSWAPGAASPATTSCAGWRRRRGWRWADVGCGNGAFTELLFERCAPTSVARHRPVREPSSPSPATRLAGAAGAVRRRRRRRPALGRRLVRRRRDGAGDLLRARPGEGRAPRWRASSGPAAASRRTRGTSSAAASRTPRCRKRWRGSARRRCGRRAPTRRAWTCCTPLWDGAGLVDLRTHVIAVQRSFADFETLLAHRPDRPAPGAALRGDDRDRPAAAEGADARAPAGGRRRPRHLRRARQRHRRPRSRLTTPAHRPACRPRRSPGSRSRRPGSAGMPAFHPSQAARIAARRSGSRRPRLARSRSSAERSNR